MPVISNRFDALAHKIGVEIYHDPKRTPSLQLMVVPNWRLELIISPERPSRRYERYARRSEFIACNVVFESRALERWARTEPVQQKFQSQADVPFINLPII